ncbi:hypothetical protein GOP47_0015510 [Adiantum capillus-veneris]|uniref:Uncharacterized protein n=1 Tax=Adiantum capillus-veneris TaxID=13818 RepID=A0A9D4UKH7_ADICA|nr:hypothetical protein GOP47_0015510 [Adiantum capillus-veneris]
MVELPQAGAFCYSSVLFCTARIWRLLELVPASVEKTVRIWALLDGSCLKTFEGHTASVLKASFLSGGMQIISAGADGLTRSGL